MRANRRRRVAAILAALLLLTIALWTLRGDDGVVLPTWDAETRRFFWGPGEVTIPPGFVHRKETGIDTVIGAFRSSDGTISINYDIGELAGEHGSRMGDLLSYRDGARLLVRSVKTEDGIVTLVSFPDSGCAQFYVRSTGSSVDTVVREITGSFRPLDAIPAWLRYLTPAILLSDCRIVGPYSEY